MADDNKSGTPGTGNGSVSFEPAPKLEAEATHGSGDVNFDADPEITGGTDGGSAGSGGGNEGGSTGAGGGKSGANFIGGDWREQATKFAQDAGERAKGFADEGKTRATDALNEFSRMMTDAAGTVDEKLGAEYGKYARSAADSLAGFAQTLEGKQVDDLLADAGDLVRKSPAIAIGTAAALGFVLARLIKSGVDAAGDLADSATDKNKV